MSAVGEESVGEFVLPELSAVPDKSVLRGVSIELGDTVVRDKWRARVSVVSGGLVENEMRAVSGEAMVYEKSVVYWWEVQQ
jgi:hypothetical protein